MAGLSARLLALALAWLGVATAAHAGLVVDGRERVDFVVPAGLMLDDYRNTGYELQVRGGRARVVVDASPLGASAPFSLPPAVPGRVNTLARSLASGAETRFAAASRILGWVSRNVRYELDRAASQEPEAVLARRAAYCTGHARLSVALLTAVGIPAREVSGLVLGRQGEAARFHRFIEIDYGPAGWAFSDPFSSHHVVPATYVPLASSVVETGPRLPRGLVRARQGGLVTVDVYPAAGDHVVARRAFEHQRAAALRVTVEGGRAEEVVLDGGGLRRRQALARGETTFVGLPAGRYTVHLATDGAPLLAGALEIGERERRWVRITRSMITDLSRAAPEPALPNARTSR